MRLFKRIWLGVDIFRIDHSERILKKRKTNPFEHRFARVFNNLPTSEATIQRQKVEPWIGVTWIMEQTSHPLIDVGGKIMTGFPVKKPSQNCPVVISLVGSGLECFPWYFRCLLATGALMRSALVLIKSWFVCIGYNELEWCPNASCICVMRGGLPG